MALATREDGSPEKAATHVDEAILVARARDGDSRAFETLFRTHQGRVFALCLRMTADRAKAEECTQDAFIRAWENLERFEGRAQFGTWLYRIAVNEVLSRQRSDGRRTSHLKVVASEAEAFNRHVTPGDEAGLMMDLEDAIRGLPEGARNVLVLSGVNGFSHAETAAMLGIAVGTCKAQLSRARKLLKAGMER